MRMQRWVLTLATFCLVGGSFFILSGCGESKDTSVPAPAPDEAKVQAEQDATRKAMQNQGKK
jgi:hypothetical protein